MKYYMLELNPSRSDFAQTMTEQEREIMLQHVQHCMTYMNAGKIIVFGPVMDPKEFYGLAIMAVEDEKEVTDFISSDPASQLNTYEYHPIGAVVPQN